MQMYRNEIFMNHTNILQKNIICCHKIVFLIHGLGQRN